MTRVTSSATNVTLLSSNTGRKSASFVNDSDKVAYLKLGATATTTSFTTKMDPDDEYILEMPTYTGQIDCIWEAGPTGAMQITELT